MDFENLVLNDTTKNLKCSLCSNYLSHFPIYISGDKHNICSRCYNLVPEKASYVQNEAYETVAQFIQFPCCYQKEGCLEKLLPVNITEHEKVCTYRIIKCPTDGEFTKCTWEGALPNALHHCQDKHHDIMLKNGEFQIDLSRSHQCENLLEHDSLLFIISTTFFSINKCLQFSIFNVASESCKKIFTCDITFKNGTRNLAIKCDTTAFVDKKITEIFLNSLQDRDNDSSIVIAKISLEKAKELDDGLDDKINEEFLTQLKCVSCGEYAMPPIYQDLNQPADKQIKCYECNNKANSWGAGTKGLRNINLDKIANLLNYPCKYNKNGCTAIHKPEEMKKHQVFCPFGNHVCPVNEYVGCKWSGLGRDIAAHIEASHQGMIKTNSTEISETVFNSLNSFNSSSKSLFANSSTTSKSSSVKCYIIKFSEHLFQLSFSEIDQNYYWTVQLIGQLQNNYMYELEIIDKNNKRQKLMVRQPCTSLKTRDQLFTLKNSYCYFQKNQIESFLCGQILTFTVTIYK